MNERIDIDETASFEGDQLLDHGTDTFVPTVDTYCKRCDALLTGADTEADECTQCGCSLDPPTRIPCSYPGCTRTTTYDPTYGDLCYEHIRASSE